MRSSEKLLQRVVTHRVNSGEDLETVLAEYPKASAELIETIRQQLSK